MSKRNDHTRWDDSDAVAIWGVIMAVVVVIIIVTL